MQPLAAHDGSLHGCQLLQRLCHQVVTRIPVHKQTRALSRETLWHQPVKWTLVSTSFQITSTEKMKQQLRGENREKSILSPKKILVNFPFGATTLRKKHLPDMF